MCNNTARLQPSPLSLLCFMDRSDVLPQKCSLRFPVWFLKKLFVCAACTVAPSTTRSFPGHPLVPVLGLGEEALACVLNEQNRMCFESRCWFVWCLSWSLDSLLGFWNELSNRWLGVHGSFGFRFSSLGMISLLSLAHLFPWAWLFLVAEDKDLSYCCIPLRRAALHSTVLSSSLQFSLLAEQDLAEGAGGCLWCLLAGRRALKALRQLPPWNTTVLVSMPALCVLKRLPGWDGWQPSSVSQRAGGVESGAWAALCSCSKWATCWGHPSCTLFCLYFCRSVLQADLLQHCLLLFRKPEVLELAR